MEVALFLNTPCLERRDYMGLSTEFLFLKQGLDSRLCLMEKNGKHELERLKTQNENKKHLKCIKTKPKPHKQMGLATLLHLNAFFFYLVGEVSQDLK